jgi:ribonuclease J
VKPQVLVPVHGEAAHLEAHSKLGKAHGIPTVFSARNGDLVRLFPDAMIYPAEVRTGELYLDGNILCPPDQSGVKGRRRLSFGGHVVVSVAIDSRGQLASRPQLAVEGLPEVEEEESVEDIVRRIINGTLKSIPPKRRADADTVEAALHRAVRSEVAAWWGKKPNVTVFVHRL